MQQGSSLLTPFQRKQLEKSLETELRSQYQQRIQIMLMADSGYSQTQICKALGCAQVTARYWISVAQSGNAHRWNDRSMGRPRTISEPFLHRLKVLVTQDPRSYGYGFRQWTARWLAKHLAKELGIKVSDRYINTLLKDMGLSTRGRSLIEPVSEPIPAVGVVIDDLPTAQLPDFIWQPYCHTR